MLFEFYLYCIPGVTGSRAAGLLVSGSKIQVSSFKVAGLIEPFRYMRDLRDNYSYVWIVKVAAAWSGPLLFRLRVKAEAAIVYQLVLSKNV